MAPSVAGVADRINAADQVSVSVAPILPLNARHRSAADAGY